jgi:hypothetical protein
MDLIKNTTFKIYNNPLNSVYQKKDKKKMEHNLYVNIGNQLKTDGRK